MAPEPGKPILPQMAIQALYKVTGGEAFVSRLGNRFFAPDWFVEDLPADTLDGELWVGRKMFQRTTSIVRSGAASQDWKAVTYVVFDAPNARGGFEDRIAHVEKVLKKAGTVRNISAICHVGALTKPR